MLAAHFRVPGKWPQLSTYSVHLSLGRTLGWQLAKSSLSHETARIEACIFQEFRFLLLIRLFACTTPDVSSPHVGFFMQCLCVSYVTTLIVISFPCPAIPVLFSFLFFSFLLTSLSESC